VDAQAAPHPTAGIMPRLAAELKRHLPGMLARGAEAYGFCGQLLDGSRTLATQTGDDVLLFASMRLPGLVLYHEASNRAAIHVA
jgi:hypothetical protein